mmetsp:Transcript_21461/g.44625  ORF Transcript_21461/g.44625 Transcript_21461/m.44625 type:complete len:135 (+) Transcript_21461:1292-1696(+)
MASPHTRHHSHPYFQNLTIRPLLLSAVQAKLHPFGRLLPSFQILLRDYTRTPTIAPTGRPTSLPTSTPPPTPPPTPLLTLPPTIRPASSFTSLSPTRQSSVKPTFSSTSASSSQLSITKNAPTSLIFRFFHPRG